MIPRAFNRTYIVRSLQMISTMLFCNALRCQCNIEHTEIDFASPEEQHVYDVGHMRAGILGVGSVAYKDVDWSVRCRAGA